MKRQELAAKAAELQMRREKANAQIASLARMLVPLLKDHKLDRVAEELGAKIFELDLVQEESLALIKDNSDTVSEMMFERFRGPRL